MIIKDYIEKEIQHDKKVFLISIDLRKPFDLTQTNVLLQKKVSHLVHLLGNEGPLHWISSYFSNRFQYTNWNQTSSNPVKCNIFDTTPSIIIAEKLVFFFNL